MTSHSDPQNDEDVSRLNINQREAVHTDLSPYVAYFNALLNGALYDPVPMFTIYRLQDALWHVVTVTGDLGRQALDQWCNQREERDRHDT